MSVSTLLACMINIPVGVLPNTFHIKYHLMVSPWWEMCIWSLMLQQYDVIPDFV